MPPKRALDSGAEAAVRKQTKRRKKAPRELQNTRKSTKKPRKEKVVPAFYGEIIEEINSHGVTEYKVRWEPTWVTTSIPVGEQGDIDVGGMMEMGRVLKRKGGKALVEWTDTLVAEEDVAIEELEKWKRRERAPAVETVSPLAAWSSPGKNVVPFPSLSSGADSANNGSEKTAKKKAHTPDSTDVIVVATDDLSPQASPPPASHARDPLRELGAAHNPQNTSSTRQRTPPKQPLSSPTTPARIESPKATRPVPQDQEDCDDNLAHMPSPIVGESSRTPAAKLRSIQSAKHFGQTVARLLNLSPLKDS